jgi:type VI secretion system secreted protein VgrG
MSQQVKANIELENGKKLTHYQTLEIKQDLFKHHSFEIIVPLEMLENEDESFFNKAHKDVCGKAVTVSFEPVLTKSSFDFKFKGIITEILLSNLSDMSNVFVLKGYSPTIMLEDCTIRRTFIDKNVQQIFETVLNDYPGNSIKKKLSARHKSNIKYAVQYDETNFDFLNRLAAEYGEWFFYNGKELVLGESDTGKETEFTIDGKQSFDMAISLLPAKFRMSGYDYTKDQLYNGQSSSQQVEGLSQFGKFALDESENLFSQESLFISNKPLYSQSDLDELIKFRRSTIVSSMINFHGRGEIPDISIGSVISVSGTRPEKGGRSKKESFGKYRITELIHSVDGSGNYSNVFKAVPETAKFPPVNTYAKHPKGQPELAKVTDNNDPDKLSRVKVQFNWLGDDKDSDWIRVGSFYVGGDDRKGMQFIPEKEAQVLVGYEHDRPDQPFIMTGLFPKKDGMRSLKGNNDEKLIYTKAGNMFELIDKKGENKIRITNVNKDDTSIILEFKDNGQVTIQTNGKVKISAGDSIEFSAQQNISLKAQSIDIKADNELKCEGQQKATLKSLQISIEADSTAEVKASMSAKLTSPNTEVNGDAMTTIKGGLVRIN